MFYCTKLILLGLVQTKPHYGTVSLAELAWFFLGYFFKIIHNTELNPWAPVELTSILHLLGSLMVSEVRQHENTSYPCWHCPRLLNPATVFVYIGGMLVLWFIHQSWNIHCKKLPPALVYSVSPYTYCWPWLFSFIHKCQIYLFAQVVI